MHIIKNSTCWECKQTKEKLVCFDGLEKWQDNAEICLDCLAVALQSVQANLICQKRRTMIFIIQTDDKVAGLDITDALSRAGIEHTILSKQRDEIRPTPCAVDSDVPYEARVLEYLEAALEILRAQPTPHN